MCRRSSGLCIRILGIGKGRSGRTEVHGEVFSNDFHDYCSMIFTIIFHCCSWHRRAQRHTLVRRRFFTFNQTVSDGDVSDPSPSPFFSATRIAFCHVSNARNVTRFACEGQDVRVCLDRRGTSGTVSLSAKPHAPACIQSSVTLLLLRHHHLLHQRQLCGGDARVAVRRRHVAGCLSEITQAAGDALLCTGNSLCCVAHEQQLHCDIGEAGGVAAVGAGGSSSSAAMPEVPAAAGADEGIAGLATKACRFDTWSVAHAHHHEPSHTRIRLWLQRVSQHSNAQQQLELSSDTPPILIAASATLNAGQLHFP